jgi:uncharacterized tellurite resistance protein B-like protein
MIKKLINQVVVAISAPPSPETGNEQREAALRTATAVLMLDVARADHVFEDSEFTAPEEAAQLVNSADEKAESLVSLHDFTQLLHKNLEEDEKARIVSMLWQVAYADGNLDKYEDSLVLKISDLLHVSRGRVMRLKHDAELAAAEAQQ